MTTTTIQVYQVAQVRELERLAREQFGLSGDILLQRAGQHALTCLRQRWPMAKRIAVLCGTGNNGGDGYTLAFFAHKLGLDVCVWHIGELSHLKDEALRAYENCKAQGIPINSYTSNTNLQHLDVIVDAIFGIGIHNNVHGQALAAIEKINQSATPVFALDIPSGIDANTGFIYGLAVKATLTITFIGMKLGLLTGSGIAYAGAVVLNDLQLPQQIFALVLPVAKQSSLTDLSTYLKPRSRDWHKGNAGHVLVVGGDKGFLGAVRMAAEAALRVGAGLVSVATRCEHANLLALTCPEIMSHGVESIKVLTNLLMKATVVIVGPGMGHSTWAKKLLKVIFDTQLPLVVDADGLNLLAVQPCYRENWILTPHPGEAARLLQTTVQAVQRDRFTAGQLIQNKFAGVCVLKGAGTLIFSPPSLPAICSAGNPGMATAGMGDVLSGVIGGLVAQHMPLANAAKLGVFVHASAGDLAAQNGERGMIATDLMPYLRRLVNS